MYLFKVSSQRCTSNISCVLYVTRTPMSCVRRCVRNTWVASVPAGRPVLTQRGDGGPPWNCLPPNRTATLPIAPLGNQVFLVVCITAWFPSSSCSCQCPCGCGSVVKRYLTTSNDWIALNVRTSVYRGTQGSRRFACGRKFERTVDFLKILPWISSDFCSDFIYQLRDRNPNFGDSILAEFNNYRSYGTYMQQWLGNWGRTWTVQWVIPLIASRNQWTP